MKKILPLLPLLTLAYGASAGTIVVGQFGDDGWFSDDTRNGAGVDLVGLNYTHHGKPGQTATAADDTAIASQIQFPHGAPGGRTALLMTKGGPGNSKCTLSKVNADGFAVSAGGGSWAAGFSMEYAFYTTNTAELPVPKIGVRSTLWGTGSGQSQSGFTAIRSGEPAWDLVLVDWRGTVPGWPTGSWTVYTADPNTNCWRVYRQAGNSFFNAPPASALSLVELAAMNDTNNPAHVAATIGGTPYTWSQVLFGDGAKVASIQLGVGSSTATSTGYLDYLKLNFLNGGDPVDFGSTTLYVDAVDGSDLTGDGSPTNPYQTITNGISKAHPRDTIIVEPGTYNESFNINKSVRLRGIGGREVTTIVLQSGPTYLGSITIGASDVLVEGFTIVGHDAPVTASPYDLASTDIFLNQNITNIEIASNRIKIGQIGPESNYDDGFGVLTTWGPTIPAGTDNLFVHDNLFEPVNTVGTGAFYVNPGVDHFTFSNNVISGEFGRTATAQALNGLVENNTVVGTGSSAGLGTWGYPAASVWGHTLFQGNVITNTARAITLYDSEGVVILNNTLDGNGYGVYVADTGYTAYNPANGVEIHSNSFAGNLTAGIGNTTTGLLAAANNWWGSAQGPTTAANPCGGGNGVSANVVFSPWLGDGTDTSPAPGFQPNPTPVYYTPASLRFSTQPGDAEAANLLSPQPVLEVMDENGGVAHQFQCLVTVASVNDPVGTLNGDTSQNAVNGVVIFTNLSLSAGGYNYRLEASSPGLISATSSPFNVTLTNVPPELVTPVAETDTNATMYGAVRYKVLNLGGGSDREIYLGQGDLGVGTNRHEKDFSWSITNVIVFSYDPSTGVESTTVSGLGGEVSTNYTVGVPPPGKPVDYLHLLIKETSPETPFALTISDLNGINLGTFHSISGSWQHWAITDPSLFQTGFVLTATLTLSGTGGNCNECDKVELNFGNLQRLLTVTADAQSKEYGDADPALTWQITSGALEPGDTLSGTLTRVAGEDVGSYQIQQGTLTADSKYVLTFVPSGLTVTPRPLTVTADAQSKGYGDADPGLTCQITSGTLVDGDTLSGALARVPGENAGSYEIQQGTLTAGSNYTLAFVPASLAITKRALTARPDDKSRAYGLPNPVFTITYTGFVNSEDAGVLDVPPLASTSAQTNSPAGTYDITLTGGGDNNYSLVLSNGTLWVFPAEANPPAVKYASSPRDNDEFEFLPTDTVISGTALDDTRVEQVWVSLNGNAWQSAAVTRPKPNTANWTIVLALAAGTNTVQVKAVDPSGNESDLELRRYFRRLPGVLTVNVIGNGTVTTNGGVTTFYVGRVYHLTAVPGTGYLFSNWVDSVRGVVTSDIRSGYPVVTMSVYPFLMESNLTLTASFVTNRFLGEWGKYNGLFWSTNGVTHQSAGYFSLKTTTRLKFSGVLYVDGQRVGCSGVFGVSGNGVSKEIKRKGRESLWMTVHLPFDGSDKVTGVVSNVSGTWLSQMLGDRDVYYSTGSATNYAGKYTMVIAGGTNAAVAPAGDGYALITAKANGQVKSTSGMLSDGHKLRTFTRVHTLRPVTTTVSKNGDWPFYAMLYSEPWTYVNSQGVMKNTTIGKGSILGWMQFTNGGNRGLLEGNVTWIKTSWTNNLYPDGFTNQVLTLGSAFTPPPNKSRALDLTNAIIVTQDGNLGAPFTNSAVLGVDNKFILNAPNVNNQKLGIARNSGKLTGYFYDPNDGTETLIHGVVLQDHKVARGFFLGTTQSGSVRLQEP